MTQPRLATTAEPPLNAFISDLTIDPKFDVDVFSVQANAGDRIRVDIDAKIDGSALDAKVAVLSPERVLLCQNDDDGATSDPFVVCTATSTGVHFIEVTSYDDNSGRNHTYALNLQVIAPDREVTGPEIPEPPTPPPARASWTAMIYLAGDTNLCRDYDSPDFSIIRGLENQLNDKIGPGGFLNVVVLFGREH
ncbi:MAG: PPC domain-containing protein [Caldilineaceae bacterium]